MRVLGLYIALITIFSGVILAIRLIGGTQPNPIAVLFTNPDGTACQMPCLFGVYPGKMTLDEALRVLEKHPLTREMLVGGCLNCAILYSQEASINLTSDGNVVYLINLTGYGHPASPHNPQLAWTIHQADPGNQTLYFRKIGEGCSDQQPYLIMYCYDNSQIWFEYFEGNNDIPWQSKSFSSLKIYNHNK